MSIGKAGFTIVFMLRTKLRILRSTETCTFQPQQRFRVRRLTKESLERLLTQLKHLAKRMPSTVRVVILEKGTFFFFFVYSIVFGNKNNIIYHVNRSATSLSKVFFSPPSDTRRETEQ